MAGVESDVLAEFTARLEDGDAVPGAVVTQLRALLAEEKLPKAETLVSLYSTESGDRRA
ncbi:hypothetical protein [Mycolicibacterium conceptionense]|nr:hypothetical protein [Mycolicibacterium conceptionense]